MTTICIGDSIVNGYPFEQSDSWVSLLGKKSGEQFVNKGIDGQTSREVLRRFSGDVIAPLRAAKQEGDTGCRVTISVGTNDFIFSKSAPMDVLENIKSMVAMSRQAILMVPILLIPEMAARFWMNGTDYNEVNEKLAALRCLILRYAQEEGLPCVDTQRAYEEWCARVGVETAYLDGVHPTKEGYREIAEIVAKKINFTSV